jgi:hypothetical protein
MALWDEGETIDDYGDLTKLHTRQLMEIKDGAWGRGIGYYAVREELAKREHIPNAAEAKKIRQQKAWRKRHR